MFLAHMSHELRTPLNGILGYTQLLKRDQNLTEAQLDGLALIERSGQHLLSLINDILDLSKIEAQKMELRESDVCLPELLQEIADVIRIRMQPTGLDFHYEVSSTLPNFVRADEKHLRQVLLNLLSNAVKFTEQGNVRFEVKSETCQMNNEEDAGRGDALHASRFTLHFSVSDTGIGIPAEHLGTIFSPFTQILDHTRKTEGTGLGLSISQQLVRLMGGELHVRSTVGEGSTFWFEISLIEVAEREGSPHEQVRRIIGIERFPACNGRILPRVLVIDDEPQNCSLIIDVLTPLGFEVCGAASGYEGLAKAQECHPDVIIVDLVMPEMDGFETIRRIRELEVENRPVIIGVSGWMLEEVQQRIAETDCDAFLPKPIDFYAVLQLLEKHLHIIWRYEEQEAPAETSEALESPLIPPSQDELEELLKLATVGDIRAIRQQLDLLVQHNPEMQSFANRLAELIKGFRIDEIQKLLKSLQKQEEVPKVN
jgi:CheY-like chemotaxis protein